MKRFKQIAASLLLVMLVMLIAFPSSVMQQGVSQRSQR